MFSAFEARMHRYLQCFPRPGSGTHAECNAFFRAGGLVGGIRVSILKHLPVKNTLSNPPQAPDARIFPQPPCPFRGSHVLGVEAVTPARPKLPSCAPRFPVAPRGPPWRPAVRRGNKDLFSYPPGLELGRRMPLLGACNENGRRMPLFGACKAIFP